MDLNRTFLRIFFSLALTLLPVGLVRADENSSEAASAITVTRSLRKQEPRARRADTFLADTLQIPSGEISYHNGLVMTNTPDVYIIWYGTWVSSGPSSAPQILTDLITSLGGSPYNRINTTYFDGLGERPSGGLIYGGAVGDSYSHGIALKRADIEAVVTDNVTNFALPLDSNGIYLVFGSADVTVDGFCTESCEFHNQVNILGTNVSYAFVGNPERCPYRCASQFYDAGNLLPTPNGNLAADAMASWLAHDLSGIITNPRLDGWYINPLIYGQRNLPLVENSDLCEDQFGQTYTTPNGARANIRLGSRDYLIQQNWVNVGGGYCALAYP